MEMIADGLLIAGALAAALYCWILSIRLKGLKGLDDGLGAAISTLSTQVDEMRRTLKATQGNAEIAYRALDDKLNEAQSMMEEIDRVLSGPVAEENDSPAPAMDPDEEIYQQRYAQRDAQKAEASAEPAPRPRRPLPGREERLAQAEATQATAAEKRVEQRAMPDDAQDETPVRSAARKLQEDIRDRVKGRSGQRGKDDYVKALQTVLAASNR